MERRSFLTGAVAGAAALGCTGAAKTGSPGRADREYYELRVYKIADADKKKIVDAYLKNAFVPALNRMSIDRVGVFTRLDDDTDHSIYTLVAYPTLAKFDGLNDALDPRRVTGEAPVEGNLQLSTTEHAGGLDAVLDLERCLVVADQGFFRTAEFAVELGPHRQASPGGQLQWQRT